LQYDYFLTKVVSGCVCDASHGVRVLPNKFRQMPVMDRTRGAPAPEAQDRIRPAMHCHREQAKAISAQKSRVPFGRQRLPDGFGEKLWTV